MVILKAKFSSIILKLFPFLGKELCKAKCNKKLLLGPELEPRYSSFTCKNEEQAD